MAAERLFTLQRGAGSIAACPDAWHHARAFHAELAPDDPARAAVLAAAEQLHATFNDLTIATDASDSLQAGRATSKRPCTKPAEPSRPTRGA